MPIKKGTSAKVYGENVQELMHSYERKGKIGNIIPKSATHAQRIANRIAYETARKAKAGKANPLHQGTGTMMMGQTPGGSCPKSLPFLKK